MSATKAILRQRQRRPLMSNKIGSLKKKECRLQRLPQDKELKRPVAKKRICRLDLI